MFHLKILIKQKNKHYLSLHRASGVEAGKEMRQNAILPCILWSIYKETNSYRYWLTKTVLKELRYNMNMSTWEFKLKKKLQGLKTIKHQTQRSIMSKNIKGHTEKDEKLFSWPR